VYMTTDRLPALLFPQDQSFSSGSLSPHGFISSSSLSQGGSRSFSTAPSSNGPKTPSPSLPLNAISGPPTTITSYDAMNHGAQDMYYSQSMSAGQPPQPSPVTSSISQYSQQQPPLLQPGPAQYQTQNPYPQYYPPSNGLTSPPTAPPSVTGGMNNASHVLPLPGVAGQNPVQNQYAGFDTTGQQPPPGMKPRVTATLWEDEGSLCFQVEARGICVARREGMKMCDDGIACGTWD
jgi:protein SOK2